MFLHPISFRFTPPLLIPARRYQVNKSVLPTAIFDTSGMNKLADDPESEILTAAVKSSFLVRLTETHVSEIVANREPSRRAYLLESIRPLSAAGECIYPYHVILEELIRAFEESQSSFDWTHVSVRFAELEDAIGRRDIDSEELAAAQLNHAKAAEQEFRDLFDGARPRFDPICEDPQQRPSIRDLIARFKQDDGAIWAYGEKLYGKVATKPVTHDTIRTFYDACPPFRAIVLALCVAQHERCIRDLRHGQSLRAGRADLFAATYLPYCDHFVTDDNRQLRSLQVIAAEGAFNAKVCSYSEFRAGLVGVNAVG